MKLIILAIGMLLLFKNGVVADDNLEARDAIVQISDVYIPSHLTADSESYVVVYGLYSNSCYRWKDAIVMHREEEFEHIIEAHAMVQQGMCLMVLVPFSQEVKLGRLKMGTHMLRFINGDGTFFEKMMHVK